MQTKYVVFLADGLADEPIAELDEQTPLMAAHTPHMDRIAREGKCGTLLTLPEGLGTSSDIANLSVLGYDPAVCHTGRGPIEAASVGIDLKDDEIAFRCNLITVEHGILTDYSSGHIPNHLSTVLINDLQQEFGTPEIRFVAGNSYRNLLILKGAHFSPDLEYSKADSCHGERINDLWLKPRSPEAEATANLVNDLTRKTGTFLERHPINQQRVLEGKNPANLIWPFSPGRKPTFPSFDTKYGKTGAMISAVDVINGIGVLAGMTVIKVPGATGWIDTNFEGKAEAAVKALHDHDFVFLHVECIDECGHLGDLKQKMEAIELVDKRLIGHFFDVWRDDFLLAAAVIPDHPVPLALRKHTRTPVPFAIMKPGMVPDAVHAYNELACKTDGAYGELAGDGFMRALFAS